MMSSMKRKEPVSGQSSKQPKKKAKHEASPSAQLVRQSPKENAAKTHDAARPVSSILANEQPAFPRGGAGLLSPVERKEIQAKASRDAAKEHQAEELFNSKSGPVSDSDNSDLELEDVKQRKQPVSNVSAKRRKGEAIKIKSDSVAIEGLSYKRLTTESLLLGCVSSIGTSDVTISLPNNLVGFIPLTAISRQFTNKAEKVLNEDSSLDGAADEESDLSLAHHFATGQFLRVAVTSLSEESEDKAQRKKRIDLSAEPSSVNRGLDRSNLAIGCTVQVAVVSVEDHGLVVDLGLEDGTTGFIPAKAFISKRSLQHVLVGSVYLCSVTSLSSNGKIVKLSTALSPTVALRDSPSIDSFLPGTLVEVLLNEVTDEGMAGKVMGMLDVTADVVHSGSSRDRGHFAQHFQIGKKVKGRLTCTFPQSKSKKLGFSVLPQVISLNVQAGRDLKISSVISEARILRAVPGLGIYATLPSDGIGFAHISRLSDKMVDSVGESTGPYKLDSLHKARILDYNALDDLYVLSLQKSVIDQPFLRVDDVEIGQVVKATVQKLLLDDAGIKGVILNLSQNVSGLVPQIHLSDVALMHPEKKFREGASVTARVLAVNRDKRQVRLTLKKTLVNSDQRIWSDFRDVVAGESALGTLVKVDQHGALVQFYGSVRGYLPVSEMSEAYIKDATEHFKTGQVLNLYALTVKPDEQRLTVSAREPSSSREADLSGLVPGSLTFGTVFEKSQSDLLLRLQNSGAIARLSIDHISDGSEKKRRSALERIRVGQKLESLLILDVQKKQRLVNMSNKASLITAAQQNRFLNKFEDLREESVYTGFVSNITDNGVFVRFAAGITGLIPKHQVPNDAETLPEYGMQKLQSITAKVSSIDYRGATPRFWLTMRDIKPNMSRTREPASQIEVPIIEVVEPVDDTIRSFSDFAVGKNTTARIVSVKETQINVELAKGVQGRVDVSEIFDEWDDIHDRKQPLKQFSIKQLLLVRILGAHDSRNHRFLPLSHRTGKNIVFELSARPSVLNSSETKITALDDLEVGDSRIVFVNNISNNYLMVNVNPAVRGRIRATDVSDDLTLVADLRTNFPIGSAIRARVAHVDAEKNHLDLSARSGQSKQTLSIDEVAVGDLLPGKITKISDRSLVVQLGENLVGVVDLIDIADDFELADTARHRKNEIVRVSVIQLDKANKKILLSLRPSRVLSLKSKVRDPEVFSIDQVDQNDIRRGFIKNVSDKGIFVTLGHGVTAFVRVSNLSDEYLKDWKNHFERDQLVEGRVINVDKDSGHCQMSLRKSHVSGTYRAPIAFSDLKVGDTVTGKIAKVETFGVFILVGNSENVRGLCHRSEIAEKRIEDATTLGFNEGDVVKAKVMKMEPDKRRINFGMKASYFAEEDSDDASASSLDAAEDEKVAQDLESADEDDDESADGMEIDLAANDLDGNGSGPETGFEVASDDDEDDADSLNEDDRNDSVSASLKRPMALSAGGFDWAGASDGRAAKRTQAPTDGQDEDSISTPKKKKRKSAIQVDKTGDLDAHGPQSIDDFERLLLGEPDSVELWLRYIAFHIDLGDLDQARETSERALKSIGVTQENDKLMIWVALLNLENTYGDDETLETVFNRACVYQDAEEVHNKLVSIYIRSGKQEKADELFHQMTKKFTQNPKQWLNYATFLFDTKEDPVRARALLPRALQALPTFQHFDVTLAFARLEFKTKSGVPEEGRTRFQGLINLYPKRLDLFNVLLDLEAQQQQEGDPVEQIRQLYEQIFDGRKLKPGTAKKFFNQWIEFERHQGDRRRIDEVEARAARWVQEYKDKATRSSH